MKWIVIPVGSLALVAALALGAVLWQPTAQGDPFRIPEASEDELADVADHKVFFAHKSVGYNILDALPGVYEQHGLAAPAITESRAVPGAAGFSHTAIGENGDPRGKIAQFDALMRSGLAEQIDVAVLKLCYVDFRESRVDVEEVFAAYRDTMTALARDYPDTAFVAATSPLTTERGPLGKVRAALGRGDSLGPEHNVVRERFNTLVRGHFTEPGALFDIAGVQSTTPGGDRVAYTRDGERYYAMDAEYASDPGHLNADGAAVAASAFVAVVADALR